MPASRENCTALGRSLTLALGSTYITLYTLPLMFSIIDQSGILILKRGYREGKCEGEALIMKRQLHICEFLAHVTRLGLIGHCRSQRPMSRGKPVICPWIKNKMGVRTRKEDKPQGACTILYSHHATDDVPWREPPK